MAKGQRRKERREYRLEKKRGRQSAKTERVGIRAETKQTAYEHGIDPNAWISDSIGSAAGAVSSIMGKPGMGYESGSVSFQSQPSGGCYVSSAVFGSEARETNVLREFRDGVLVRTYLGILFVRCYYKISPFFVKFFTEDSFVKKIIRGEIKIFIQHYENWKRRW